jgi:hypothetical protein
LAGEAILKNAMHRINDSPHGHLYRTPSRADAIIGDFDAYVKQSKTFASYVSYAIETLHEQNMVPPDVDRVILIVQSALAAQSLFFAAALHHPGKAELYQFFESFVLSCVTSTQETEGI